MAKGNGKKSKKKLFIFGGLGLLLVAVILLAIFSGDKETIISVQTEKVEKRDITQTVKATGKINPVYQVTLRPEVTGEIVSLPVKEGDKVKKGQLLIRLKPEQYIARKNKAEASLTYARAQLQSAEAKLLEIEGNYKRVMGLFEKQLASEAEMQTVKSAYFSTLAQIEAQKSSVLQAEESFKDAEVELAKTAIYAPLDGTVSALNVEMSERVLGSSFSQGTDLMTVADLSRMESTVEVDENDVVLISVGDTANISIDAFGDRKFKGIVTQIGNSAKTAGFGTQEQVVNFDVKIELVELDDKIRPGMSCDAVILTETKRQVVSVPIQSISARMPKSESKSDESDSKNENEQKENLNQSNKKEKIKSVEVVFLEENNKAKMVEVKTGISDDSYMEILSGLEGGEKVISGPYKAISKDLEDGSTLRLTNQSKDKKNTSDKN